MTFIHDDSVVSDEVSYLVKGDPPQDRGTPHCWLLDWGSEFPQSQSGRHLLSSNLVWGSLGRGIEVHWIMLHLLGGAEESLMCEVVGARLEKWQSLIHFVQYVGKREMLFSRKY